MIKVFPSIFAADFGCLADEAKRIEDAGADGIHVDIMDWHFVPNLTFGPKALAAINRSTDLFLDVHIMVYNPYDLVERLIEMGADRITFHFEATENVEETLKYIQKCGIQVGLAFNPETSYEMAPKFLGKCDLMLFMTVHPGFGGQSFIKKVMTKVKNLKSDAKKAQIQKPLEIQVDGGINDQTAKIACQSGANVLVVGTHLFKQPDLTKGIENLKKCLKDHK